MEAGKILLPSYWCNSKFTEVSMNKEEMLDV